MKNDETYKVQLVEALIRSLQETNDPIIWNLCANCLTDLKSEKAMPEIEKLLFSEKSIGRNATLAYALNEYGWKIKRSEEEIDQLLKNNPSEELHYEIEENLNDR